MSIFKTLKFDNVEIGKVQSVDEMTLVPILGNDRGDIASPSSLNFKRTSSYGTMIFENSDPYKDAIVISNFMVRGVGAQDHAMSSAGIVAKNKTQSFYDACCVEQSQGGYLESENNEEDVLPVGLRKALLNPSIRTSNNYNKLWNNIRIWLHDIKGIKNDSAHLRFFYDNPNIKKSLEKFAAEFESVENQIGAIVMFSGIPVGIEIMPSFNYWERYWKLLIRGCYGAEMIRLKLLGKLKPLSLMLPEIPKTASNDKIEEIFDRFAQSLRDDVSLILKNISINSQTAVSHDGTLSKFTLTTPSGGGGDIIQQNNSSIYLSLVL